MLNPLAKRKQEHDIQICVKKIHDGAQRFRANLAKMDAAQVGKLQQLLFDQCTAMMLIEVLYLVTLLASPCRNRQAVRDHLQCTWACMQELHEGACIMHCPWLLKQAAPTAKPTWADRQCPAPAPPPFECV